MSYRYPQQRILIMARAPIPGQAKTRLIPALGEEGAAALHRRLVLRLLDALDGAALAPLQLWCSPAVDDPFFQQCSRRYRLTLHAQQGADLGERMEHALRSALNDASAALVIGCDIPELGPRQLRQACAWLEEGADAVLGPSEDGGYTLLGLHRVAAELFTDMPWGSERVLQQTRQRLAALDWQTREIETLWDLDRPEDLARLKC